MTDRRWQPVGGIDRPFVDTDLEIFRSRTAVTGRNGVPDLVPYVRLREVRERLGFEHVTGWYDQFDREAKTGGEEPEWRNTGQ
ncbi:MAG: hypothetical protein HRJ53_08305 [Acidobacteria bacterium Pan2503]|uniref:Uncharacterized protein n=1 Tax=Candidatus Acidiferrum panamense TaxID=2741543 RepID=A0A7V8NP67_9BACT|nr:hypothetical protein [Candidatus Acidoferrum panamensis]